MARPDRRVPPRLYELESRDNPTGLPGTETFDSTVPPSLPAGWVEWSNDGIDVVSVQSAIGVGQSPGVATQGTSRTTGYAWNLQTQPADTGAAISIYTDSLVPALLMARGQNLNSSSPSYLAAVVTRGLSVELWQVSAGKVTVLASLQSPSKSYLSSQWVNVSLVPRGETATITITRQDTGQYLNSQGQWQTAATSAITAAVSPTTGSGLLGFGRAARYSGIVKFDNFTILPAPTPPVSPPPVPPSTTSGVVQNFDQVLVGSIPNAWSTWSTSPTAAFQVSAPKPGVPTNALASNSPNLSTAAARAWAQTSLGADVDVSVSVNVNTLISAQVLARGTNLDTATPTYYAVTMTRGLQVSLVKVQNGVTTTLGSIRSATYFSGQWVRVHLIVDGDQLRVTITRQDNGQYLQINGTWASAPGDVLDIRDSSINDAGKVGVARASSVAGTVTFDDFEARSITDTVNPTVAVQAVGTLAGPGFIENVDFKAVATPGSSPIVSLEFLVNGVTRSITSRASATWTLDTRTLVNGRYTLTVRAFDVTGWSASTDLIFDVNNPPIDPTPTPTAPSKYSHIRIAMLAYSGTPIGDFEKSLLQSSVDLVIPNAMYLATINSVAPDTPQLIYTNLSNIYGPLLTDWLKYADTFGRSREDAFYHVAQPTAFTGSSSGSQPVNWFWNVTRADLSGTNPTDLTYAARGTSNLQINWGTVGQAVALGYTDAFREINIDVARSAGPGWAGVWEYATINSQGQTVWKTLTLLGDGTSGFTRTGMGTITFDPPPDWVATIANGGSTPYFSVRFRVTSGSSTSLAPQSKSILGRDYVRANGGQSGTIPAFDFVADRNGDGYLNDVEYAGRSAGLDARFVYETRLFYPFYGQMRFVLNPSSAGVEAWAADYHKRLLAAQPLADGLFVDNSSGRLSLGNVALRESTANFSSDYAAMVDVVNRAVSPKWVVSNTVGGRSDADATTAASSAAFEEFLLRPLVTNWSEFNDVVDIVNRRLAADGSPYLIMDSLPDGGSTTDPRTQLATLAYYYLLADPERTFLMFYGGYDPASSWTEHWSAAASVDIGQPTGSFTTLASGTDPANGALSYKVFSRQYTNGLVLYKPLSYAATKGEGTTADDSRTLVTLNGTYKLVNANGTVSSTPITSLWLRNGEGAVLVKA